jgi:hypothetical protein
MKAVAAMRAAVRNVVEDHRRQGKPLILWRNGKVVREMPATANVVKESGVSYGADAQKDAHED